MKWLFATVAVLAAGGIAAFAIYTWGWHEGGGGNRKLESRVARLEANPNLRTYRPYINAISFICKSLDDTVKHPPGGGYFGNGPVLNLIFTLWNECENAHVTH